MPAVGSYNLFQMIHTAFLLVIFYQAGEVDAYVSKPKIFYDLAMNATFPDTVSYIYILPSVILFV